MINHNTISSTDLHKSIRNKTISFAGNERLKIYGTLHCSSGKRMKKENRVFFQSEKEAIKLGYRPCGHCMNAVYNKWKDGSL